MAVEIVAPVPRRAPQGTARTALAGATALLLTLAVAATLSKSAGTAGVELAAAGHDTERLASAATGHYFANGKEHFFKLTGPPSAYMDPNDNGQTEYRSASTSGLGFAGGGDPYKYIETGHYAKILAHENQVQKGWYNGTFAKQGVKQALASIRGLADLKRVNQHEIRARDETLLQLLSAPVSASELKAVLPKGGKKMEAVQVRDLNQYIKQQVDNFTPAERKKLESLDPAQLRQLKSSIVKSTVRATALHEEAGTNVFAKKAAKPVSVEQEVIAAKKRAASMMHHNTQQAKAAAIKGTKAQPKIVKGKALAAKPQHPSISAARQRWLAKERALDKAGSPAPTKAEKGGFADIEAARKRKAIAAKEKAQDDKIVASVGGDMRVDRGDPRNVAAGHVAFNHDAFWDDKEAQKLSHTSVYSATRQTATSATNGYRTTPAMSDPYRYIRTGNYAKILSQEALNTPPIQKTP